LGDAESVEGCRKIFDEDGWVGDVEFVSGDLIGIERGADNCGG
jgi:hypothetical protein